MGNYFSGAEIIDKKYFTNFKDPNAKKPRVLFFQANNFASGYYRVGFVAEELAKRGNFEIDLIKKGLSNEDLLFRIGGADVVVFQLQINELTSDIIKTCVKNKIKVVMDMDDDLLNVPDWNPAYFTLGRERNAILEKTMGKKMNVDKNEKRLRYLERMLIDVDLITVTGKGLRNAYSKFNKVKMLPNSVDPKRIKKSKRSGGLFDKKIRIFWQGSNTHMMDLIGIRNVVQAITEKYKHVQWFIWGSGYHSFAKVMGIPKDRVETKETVAMEDYYGELKKIKMDIGICPLVNIPYNRCKSNIKWLEYSLCGIPTVADDVSIYADSISHKETGYIARYEDEWINYLSKLIENESLREFIANSAEEQILQEFNIHTNIERWEDTFKKLI